MKEKDKILNSGILEQYALGLLEGKELEEVERYLQKYPELKEHLKGVQEAMELIVSQNGIEPPPKLRQNILKEIDRLDKVEDTVNHIPQNKSRNILPLVATLAAIGLVVVVFLFSRQNRRQHNSYGQLERRYEELATKCAEQGAIAAQELDYLMHSSTQTIQLKGSNKAPEALIAVYFNQEERKALLSIVNLPKPPADKQYQLWADVNGHMENMGVFGATIFELQEMTFVENASSLNITLEPLGGSKEATVEELRASGEV